MNAKIAFLFKTMCFVIPVCLFFEIIFRLGYYPVVTNSTLFDLKMIEVQKRHLKDVKLLAIGSSITLYDLKSGIIAPNINEPYYNFGSYFIQMSDIKALLPDFLKKYHPKYVLICSSLGDFTNPANETYPNYINANGFVKGHLPEAFYLSGNSSIHRIMQRKYGSYPVKFDNWGGASLTVKPKDINPQMWNGHDIFPTKYTAQNYRDLDSVVSFLNRLNIKLIFMQAPLKKSYANTTARQQVLTAHFAQCKSIVESHSGTYLNYYNPDVFTDNLFIDGVHLQDVGAVVLTKEVVNDLQKIIK